jgi:hypothetical protein
MILHDEKLGHYDCKGAEDKVEKNTWKENFTSYGGRFFLSFFHNVSFFI